MTDLKNSGVQNDPIAQREGSDVDPHETQHPGFRPGSHEPDAAHVSGRLGHAAGREDNRAEGAAPELHKPARADAYAHGRSAKDRRGY